jgi:hypothetical protein
MKSIFNKYFKYAQILGILNITFKPTLVQKFSRIKIYYTLALPILSYGSEICTLIKEDKKQFPSIEIKFFRRTPW